MKPAEIRLAGKTEPVGPLIAQLRLAAEACLDEQSWFDSSTTLEKIEDDFRRAATPKLILWLIQEAGYGRRYISRTALSPSEGHPTR